MKHNSDDYKSDSDILDEVLEAEQEFFEAVEDTAEGFNSIVIAKGPPGVGKSFGVDQICKQAGVVSTDLIGSDFIQDQMGDWHCTNRVEIDGAVRRGSDYATWALVTDLYGNSNGGVLNLEDNDKVLKDDVFVGVLMQATEQKKERIVSYAKTQSTNELRMRGVPSSFDFQGSIIVTTNINMLEAVERAQLEEERSHGKSIMKDYLKRWSALMSRGSYVDLQMNSPRSVRVYCENKITSTKMLTESEYLDHKFGRSLTKDEEKDAMAWLRKNQPNLHINLDLRTYNKLAGIMIRRGDNWERSAKVNLLKRGA